MKEFYFERLDVWLAARDFTKDSRALTNDPGMGVIRHADAGYEHALDVARERGIDLPSLGIEDHA